MDRSPAGSGASVGSGLPIDRERVAARLGFSAITANSLDAVADRDYALEVVSAAAITMVHLSRIGADLVPWSTPYLGFARISDGYATGSSMLPNKRNPDIAELVRGRAARANGALASMLGVITGLPLGYHRDLQETRGPMHDASPRWSWPSRRWTGCSPRSPSIASRWRRAAGSGHALATALAERMLRAGVPFREAHWRVGDLVAEAETPGCDLAELPMDQLRAALPELADPDPSSRPSRKPSRPPISPVERRPRACEPPWTSPKDPATMTDTVVLAYSGGLDTSVAVPWLRETRGSTS